ncbi:MAG: alpha/beta fold hydrolase [Xanthomonadales bacterium]|nr:alpha/beta fold hydrolase [Xanthomonadales bacterium]
MNTFNPPLGLRGPHVQSILNSSALRGLAVGKRAQQLLDAEEEWILDGGEGIRLQGFLTRQSGSSRGLAVLMHGWEGSSHSNYMLGTGQRLLAEGYDVFRLNFRDHGKTHHLNPGIFHSCRLDEVIHALGDLQARLHAQPWCLAGYSLGGNFALRVARHGPAQGLKLAHCVAICPVIDPAHVLHAMETGPRFYEHYYIRKWTRSVRIKQSCFPKRYAYDEWYDLGGMRERLDFFATRYYDFASIDAYLAGYSVGGERLRDLTVPSTLLTSEDDPVCPQHDLALLPENPQLEVLLTRYGGHCGYLKNWRLESWAEDCIAARFLGAADA